MSTLPASVEGVHASPCRYLYRVHGMTLELDRPVPRLRPIADRGDPLSLKIGTVPLALEKPECADAFFQVTNSTYLYRQPGIWAMCVEDGRHACFEPLCDMSEELFWYLAMTNALGAAGYQRGMFPLHGSGVLFSDGLVAFTGQSGAGKTTLTAGLVARGYPLISDDLCLFRPAGDRFNIGGGAPEIRLLSDSVDALGWADLKTLGHQAGRDKFAFEHTASDVEDAPARAIIELAFADGPPRLERLTGIDQITVLMASIRLRMGLPSFPAARRAAGFALVTRIAATTPLYRFTRPRNYGAFEAGVDMLINEFEG